MALAEVVLMVTAPRAASCSDLRKFDNNSGSQSEDGDCTFYPARSELESSQGKDSGVDCGSDVSLPDEETSRKILQTVEFYFSDANILKDQFLLKHVRRNKEGYVSLKLVSSFRKVRNLCRNWKAVGEALKKSDTLALNDEGTKVRRLTPLPAAAVATAEKITSRTVLVYGLPGDKLSVEILNDMFAKCGEIALIRVLKSNSSTSADIKKVLNKNPEILSKGCGVVEFEELEGAKLALAMDTGKENGLRIVPVGNCSGSAKDGKPADDNAKHASPKKKKRARRSLHGSKTNLKDSANPDDAKGQPRRSSSGSLGCGNSSSSGYLSTSPADNWFSRRHSYNVGTQAEPANTTTSSFDSLKNRGRYKGSKDRGVNGSCDNGSSSKLNETESSGSRSPWRLRRELMRNELSSSSPCLTLAVPLIRMPRGPDGTRGFPSSARQSLPTTAE